VFFLAVPTLAGVAGYIYDVIDRDMYGKGIPLTGTYRMGIWWSIARLVRRAGGGTSTDNVRRLGVAVMLGTGGIAALSTWWAVGRSGFGRRTGRGQAVAAHAAESR
jgi:hypothetical protein